MMQYQSYENYMATLSHSAFFLYTDFCYKVDCLKAQAENYYSELFSNLGQPYACMIPTFQPEKMTLNADESQKHADTEPVQENLSQQLLKIRTEPSDHSSSKKAQRVHTKSRKIQRNLNQKKQRNALTNLGSQLLTYIYLKKKNHLIIKSKFPQLTSEQAFNYYEWARRIKQSMNGYINIEKLKWIWHRKPESKWEKLYLQIFRTLSLHYINSLMVPAILTSKKIAENGKALHLATRRKMLEAIHAVDSY